MPLCMISYRNPGLYDATNQPLLRDAKHALDKNSHFLTWEKEERVVDIGCGTGNVTTQVLVPLLPADYKCLVSDITHTCLLYTSRCV